MQQTWLPDHQAMALTASILGVSQDRVFEMAYEEWHGEAPVHRQADQAFVGYLFEGKLPCWVRAFTRSTLQLSEAAGMELPVTQSGHILTSVVSPAELRWAVSGLGALCVALLSRLF
jgi:hypothetical protein